MTTAQELEQRYGRGRSRRGLAIGGGILAAVVVAGAIWMTFSNTLLDVDYDDLRYEVLSEHEVTVDFQVVPPAGRDIVCIVQALDEDFGIVGWKLVEIAAAEATGSSHSVAVPTVGEASTGLVKSCWVP